MKWPIFLITSLLFFSIQSSGKIQAQSPEKIYELRSLTDTAGNDHLFYRIYKESDEYDDVSDHIYRYDVQAGTEEVFLRDYSQGMPQESQTVIDYKFLGRNPDNYVFTSQFCSEDCMGFLSRSDSSSIIGGSFAAMRHLNVEGSDSGRVYVEMGGETLIGRNGGRDWPDVDAENMEALPDSSRLDFPLTSMSPYNDSLMFGRISDQEADSNGFYRSTDRGQTSGFISDTLLGTDIQYDANESSVYLIDTMNKPGSGENCTEDTCSYGFYRSDELGKPGTWELMQSFKDRIHLKSHPSIAGKLYVWNTSSILVSGNRGKTFELLANPEEQITGFTVTLNREYYTTTRAVYELEGNQSTELKSIPLSNDYERRDGLPGKAKLNGNYPNPFNPTTKIRFSLPKANNVKLAVYNLMGREVATLVDETLQAGRQTVTFDAGNLSSGVYLYRLQADGYSETRKMLLVK